MLRWPWKRLASTFAIGPTADLSWNRTGKDREKNSTCWSPTGDITDFDLNIMGGVPGK
jgi:hypothetical protein